VAKALAGTSSRASGADVRRLVPYVPRLSIEWVAETPEVRHKQIDGTLAFVDISGFTQLTERLSRKGKIGGEEMNDLLGACFTELLDVAYDYGAGVVKWGGDAVLVLFDGRGHAARACRAALEMQRTIRSAGRLRTSSGPVTLRMSIGIHSGPIDFFLVGDLHRELVITGPAATETVATEAVAEAGEVAVSQATAAALDPRCVGAPRGSAFLLESPPDAPKLLVEHIGDIGDVPIEVCVPIDLREHLLADESEPEHRPLTSGFVHFGGADEMLAGEGPDALADALEDTVGCVQRITREHGVAFFDSDIAANGGKVLLISGAPKSHGNDEERMLRSVDAIARAETPLPLRFGINRGRVFVADFGPPYRRTYSVKGDAVNLAARLMAKAEPGQAVVADEVLERSRSRFEATELEPFMVKGKSEPIRASVLGRGRTAAESATAAAPLVGRERELQALLGALDSLRAGSASIVELVGEPGLGKSRLIEELRAHADDVRTLALECDEYASTTAYAVFRMLLRELLGLPSDADAAAAEHALRSTVALRAEHLLPWLPLVATPLGLELEDTPETAPLDERFRRERVHEVTAELLGLLIPESALLVFEDAHWLDESSADLLRYLVGQLELRPWLIVTTRRAEGPPFATPEAPGALVIELQPLDAEQASALVHAATEETPLLPHELEALAERSGGNPLFLAELVAAARQAGGIESLPDSVESLMMAQIDRLSPGDRRLLRSAAVIGAAFSVELLAEALDSVPDTDAWDRLADFLVEHGDGQLRFRHALVRDAAYEGLSFRRRRDLHAAVGAALERRLGEDSDDEAGVLSLHFFHASEFERAWRYSRLAGDHSKRVYANVEAASLYERALTAAGRFRGVADDDVVAVAESLGDVRVRLGEFEAAGDAYRVARRQVSGGAVEEARLMLKQAMVPWRLGRYAQALSWLTRGIKAVEGLTGDEATRERARLYAWKGVVKQKQGLPLQAIEWCGRAIDAAEPSGAPDALAQAYYILDWAYVALGRLDEAVYSNRALAIYEELGNLERQGSTLNNLGVIAYRRGRWAESVDLYERAQQVWERAGDHWSAAFAIVNRAEVLLDQGRLAEAEPLIKQSLRVARAAKSGWRIADIARYYGTLLARMGRFDEADEMLREAREEFDRAGERDEVLVTEARIAESLVFQGLGGEALELVDARLERAGSFEGIFVLVPTLQRIRGVALAQLGRLDEARAALEESLRQARADAADYEVALALDSLVRLGALDGRTSEEIERERDEIFGRLAIVSTREVPLPLDSAELAATLPA
jgi:class 3 adenylate cyclase/tetratricopeptide (TPR) repeat protein